MKRPLLLVVFTLSGFICLAQDSVATSDQNSSKRTHINADLNFYYFKGGEKILLPVIKVDHNNLHLEGRYNYEDLNTVSIWAGYNFSGGEKFQYTITPMIGGVTGKSSGIALGFEVTLNFGRFEFYNESEYMSDIGNAANSFGYTWTDFTYSPGEWWWLGLSAQRTRLYKTDLDLQRGVMAGFSAGKWEFTGYLYNVGFGEAFGLLTVTFGF